jgi:hypothetical protein
MIPFNDGDAAVSHLLELIDAIDRLRAPSHHISSDARCEGNATQHNGHNNIETYNHHANIGAFYNIQNNYNSPTDSPTQSHDPIQRPEGSCKQCKTLREECKILQKQGEITQRWVLFGVLLGLVSVIVQWNFPGVRQCLQLLCKLICLEKTCRPHYMNPHR